MEVNNTPIILGPKLQEAVKLIFKYGYAAVTMLNRNLGIGYARSTRIIESLENLGLISEKTSFSPRYILMSPEEWNERFSNLNYIFQEPNTSNTPANSTVRNDIFSVDKMDGYEFELFCCELLRKSGFKNFFQTRLSGDNGIDITAEKDDIKYGIQCKCYSEKLGNKCVQETYTGLAMYDCDIGAVLTNNYFSDSAIATARKTRIRLWDRDYLLKMINSQSDK